MEKIPVSKTESPEEPVERAPETPRRRWPSRAMNFLQSWSERLTQTEKEEIEEDEEDSSANTSWLKRIGKNALKGIINRPRSEEEVSPETASLNEEALDIELPDFREDTILTGTDIPESETSPESELFTSSEAKDISLTGEDDSPEADTSVEGTPALEEDAKGAIIDEATPERTAVTEAEPTVVYERATGLIIPGTPERTVLERPTESIINRAEPLAAVGMVLGAAEHHRVTKVKRRTEQLEKAQKETVKQKEHLQDKYEQLETQIQQVARKMSVATEKPASHEVPEATVASSRPDMESRQPMISPSEYSAPEHAAPVMERQTTQLAINERPAPPAEILPEVVANTYKVASPEATPDAILQSVEKAAEENIPLEGVYELRQEVKDKDSAKGDGFSGGGAGASRGQWVDPSASQPSDSPHVSQVQAPGKNNPLNELWDKQPPAYKQAVTVSAGAAVLVVFAAAIIMAIVK